MYVLYFCARDRSGVVCRVKYCNSLPDIPFDPKFITYPFDQHRWASSVSPSMECTRTNMDTAWLLLFSCGRFVQYKATSLEKQHKHELLTEPDLGVTIDLINPDTYRIDPSSKSTCHILFLIFFSDVQLIKCLYWLNQCFKLSVLLDPADEKLLEEDIQAPSSSKR